ncbi:MAG: hypothetical protein KGL35_18725 [Bradyrhizobium sp.]|nr:hypothetical protein [Bradyrhizobium sp.]
MPLLFYPRLFGNDAAVSGGGSTPPNTPTLSVVDNGDGTGAVATVAGSSAGSTNVVSTAPWSTSGNDLVWTAATGRVGDGTVALSLTDGLYVAKCQSTLSGLPAVVSNEPLFEATGGANYTSVSAALAAKLVQILQGMAGTSLGGIGASSIRKRKTAYLNDFSGIVPLPADKQFALPAIVVCYFDQFDVPPGEGPQDRDAIYVPITFVFAQETQSYATPSEALDDQFLTWQEVVLSTFEHLRGTQITGGHLPVVAGGKTYTFHNAIYRGGLTFSPERGLKNLDVGWMKFGFLVWRQAYGT